MNDNIYEYSDRPPGGDDVLTIDMDLSDDSSRTTSQSQRIVTGSRPSIERQLFASVNRSSFSIARSNNNSSISSTVNNGNGCNSILRRQPLGDRTNDLNNRHTSSRNVFDKRQLIQSQLSISQQQFNQHQREILNGFLSGNGEPNYQEAMASCLVKKRELEQAAQITTGQDNLRLVDNEVTVQGVHQDIVLHHQERVSSLEQRLRQVSIGQHQVTNLNSEKQRLTRQLQQERESSRQAVERQREDNARQLQVVEMQRDENARQLQTLNQSLSSKSDQVNSVNRQLVEKSEQLRTIQSSLTAATNSVSVKSVEISRLKSTNQALNRQVEEKNEQLVSTEQALSNVTQEKIDTERSLSEAQSWLTTAKSTIKSLRTDLSRVTKEKIDAEKSLSEAQSSCQAAKDSLTTATRLKDEAELSCQASKDALVTANQEKDAAERLLSRVTKEKDAAESSLSEVQSSLDTTKSTIESLRTGLSRANEEKEAAEKSLSRVIKEKDAVAQSLSDAQLSFANQLSSSTSETTSQMSHLESERDALELHNKELGDKVNELKEKIQEYKDEIESKEAYVDEATNDIQELKRARTSLTEQLSESTDTIEVLENEVSKSKQLRRNLELEMEKMSQIANDRGRDAQIELSKQSAKVSQLAKSLETAQGFVDKYRSDINDLQEKITGLDDQIMDLKCGVDSQDDDMGQHTNDANLDVQLRQAKVELNEAKDNLSEMNGMYLETKNQLAETQSLLKKVEQERDTARSIASSSSSSSSSSSQRPDFHNPTTLTLSREKILVELGSSEERLKRLERPMDREFLRRLPHKALREEAERRLQKSVLFMLRQRSRDACKSIDDMIVNMWKLDRPEKSDETPWFNDNPNLPPKFTNDSILHYLQVENIEEYEDYFKSTFGPGMSTDQFSVGMIDDDHKLFKASTHYRTLGTYEKIMKAIQNKLNHTAMHCDDNRNLKRSLAVLEPDVKFDNNGKITSLFGSSNSRMIDDNFNELETLRVMKSVAMQKRGLTASTCDHLAIEIKRKSNKTDDEKAFLALDMEFHDDMSLEDDSGDEEDETMSLDQNQTRKRRRPLEESPFQDSPEPLPKRRKSSSSLELSSDPIDSQSTKQPKTKQVAKRRRPHKCRIPSEIMALPSEDTFTNMNTNTSALGHTWKDQGSGFRRFSKEISDYSVPNTSELVTLSSNDIFTNNGRSDPSDALKHLNDTINIAIKVKSLVNSTTQGASYSDRDHMRLLATFAITSLTCLPKERTHVRGAAPLDMNDYHRVRYVKQLDNDELEKLGVQVEDLDDENPRRYMELSMKETFEYIKQKWTQKKKNHNARNKNKKNQKKPAELESQV